MDRSPKPDTASRPLKIGVTGHRFLAEVGKLEAAVERAFDLLTEAFPGRELRVYSALAEGADRLVAQAVLQRDPPGGLVAVLPLPQADYEQDFLTAASVAEFRGLLSQAGEMVQLPPARSRNAAYALGGQFLVEHCDALIALWDGLGGRGEGGTAGVAQAALGRGLPVLHILTGNRRPDTSTPTSLGPDQGRLVPHGLPTGS